ncbi:MAG: long-chain fatty acid--CoA ligase [Chitinophagales bacterium]|nr:long-chain fatty acid--CoA ligase [Chitinophagales bacterium]
MEVKRLYDFLTRHIERHPNDEFIAAKNTQTGEWKKYTYAEVQDLSDKVSQILINEGLQPDDKIAIISANRPEWNLADLGSQQIGVVNVPMYPTISSEDYEFIFGDAEVKLAFVGDKTIYEKVKPLLGKIPSLKRIISFDKIDNCDNLWDEIDKIKKVDTVKIGQLKSSVSEEELATIIYTSGTTGTPKGVMLTHLNIVDNLTNVSEVIPFLEGEKALSFLPLCHSFERVVFFAYLMLGIKIYYAEGLDKIGDNLKEVQPYCFSTVPRLLEKVYEKIMEKGNELTGFKRKLFYWSIELGEQYDLGVNKGFVYNTKLLLARTLVFSKWNEALGGRVKFIVTGAAAMQPRLIKLFSAAGVNIIEGYGLTETAPILTINRMPERERMIGSIGMPIPNVTVKLAEDGEILAKGKNIMKGYYNRPDLTAEVIDKDGWFHTGDIGVWVTHFGQQFLKITDRKKQLFKTAGGKYIAPQAIENKMVESPYIEQMMVVGGDQYKYIAAMIVPSFVQLTAWAKEQGIQTEDPKELTKNPKVIRLIEDEVNEMNTHFGKWEQVKKIKLLANEWTIEGGELTPTLKLKRKVMNEKYAKEIEGLFR